MNVSRFIYIFGLVIVLAICVYGADNDTSTEAIPTTAPVTTKPTTKPVTVVHTTKHKDVTTTPTPTVKEGEY